MGAKKGKWFIKSPRACIIEITDGILYFWNILSKKKSFEVCFGRISWAKSVGDRKKKVLFSNGWCHKCTKSALPQNGTPQMHFSNVFAKSASHGRPRGGIIQKTLAFVTAHLVPRVSQTLTSEIFAERVWPLLTDFSCFLTWLKSKLTFRALSHKSYWPTISWDFGNKQIEVVDFMPHGQYCWII